MSLALRNLLFTLAVPGAGAVYAPWWILTRGGTLPEPVAWPAIAIIVAGFALYIACLWLRDYPASTNKGRTRVALRMNRTRVERETPRLALLGAAGWDQHDANVSNRHIASALSWLVALLRP